MSIRRRILIAFGVLVLAGLLVMAVLVLGDVRPHTFGATEDSLAETATVLAALVESRSPPGQLALDELRATLDNARHRPLDAHIYDVDKKTVDLRIYVTDAKGLVLFDSDGGAAEGQDYSQWRDVRRALEGSYGSRASRRDPADPFSAIFYVAVPLRQDGRVIGTLAVGKQARDVKMLVSSLNRKIALAGLVAFAAAIAGGLAIAAWITRPIHRLGDYARAVGEGGRPVRPDLGARELVELGSAFEAMRDALDGRRDVEGYVRSLTHETKAPLSAIRASAELLEEDLPPADQQRFLRSIRQEVERLQTLVDRLLELSSLEARRALGESVPLDLAEIARDVAESASPLLAQKDLRIELALEGVPPLSGDRLLVRQALMNLVHNAIRWTPRGGVLRIDGSAAAGRATLVVSDTGSGVPDYALPRVFEKFYSVPVPGEPKGSGLGLPFVREVALLHGGEAAVENRPEGGCRASFSLRCDG